MREAILRTLAYFDVFDYPLTALEVWKFLYRPPARANFLGVLAQLQELESQRIIERRGGFWMLGGRSEILSLRQERFLFAIRKYRRVRRAVRFLRHLPGVRLIAVCNTLAWNHARDESDIDLFVVTSPGSIWKTRFAAVTPFALSGLRPRRGKERDALCFSFFAAETALDLGPLAIRPDDPYLAYWMVSLAPLYDPDGLMEALWDANPWVTRCLPNARPAILSDERRQTSSHFSPSHGRGRERGWGNVKMDLFESLSRAVQMLKFPETIRSCMNIDHRVVVTDEILKFHENDRREFFRAAFYERCRSLGV